MVFIMLSCPVHQGRERKERKGMKEMKEERSERRKEEWRKEGKSKGIKRRC